MTDAVVLNEVRMIDAARRYAAADKSDPFAFARAMAHIRAGLCGPCEDSDMLWCNGDTRKSKMIKIGPPAGSDGHYSAKVITRNANEVTVIDYMDIKRL